MNYLEITREPGFAFRSLIEIKCRLASPGRLELELELELVLFPFFKVMFEI